MSMQYAGRPKINIILSGIEMGLQHYTVTGSVTNARNATKRAAQGVSPFEGLQWIHLQPSFVQDLRAVLTEAVSLQSASAAAAGTF